MTTFGTEGELDTRRIEEFWRWFSGIARDLSMEPENKDLLQKLDSKVRSLHPAIAWEIGPGERDTWQLVISPDLDPDLLPVTEAIISHAPTISGWEFHAARQPKDWNNEFEMERNGGSVSIDARDWKYVLLRYPDGNVEILLHGDNAKHLSKEERWQAASIFLQGILGEKPLLDKHLSFDLSDKIEENLRDKLKPISLLPQAFGFRSESHSRSQNPQ